MVDDQGRVRVGLLYPTRGTGEDDYVALARALDPAPEIVVEYVSWGADVDRLETLDPAAKAAALREVGAPERLRDAAGRLRGARLDAVTWACSSCSFLWGTAGARRQARTLSELLGVPASSAALAFPAAAEALRLRRIGLGSVYHPTVTDAFIAFLADAGVKVVHRVDLDVGSDLEVARWGPDRMRELADAANHPDAEAVMIPETALHTAGILGDLEARAGKPVLTATQVTLWDALRLAGRLSRATGLGALFDREPRRRTG